MHSSSLASASLLRATAGLLALLLVSLAGAWPARAAPTNFLGVNTHQPADDVLDGAKDLGASWVRIDFNWYQVQPTAGQTDFSLLDKIVNAALARGLKVFPTIGYGPTWATEADADGKPYNNTPKVGEYQKFCQTAAAYYKGKITHWGLWNEPNLGFFEGTRQQWIDRVVIEGIKGIKAGCPSCKVLGPELATVGNDYDKWFADSIKALKSAGLMYDIVTWHIYSTFLDLKPTWLCWDGDLFVHDLDAHRVCFGIHMPLSPWEVMVQYGISSLQVWITETGYTAPISDSTKTANQVTYYRRAIEEQLKRSWWTHTFFYEIVDDNTISDKWGMAVRSGTSPTFPGSYQLKPVWSFVKKVLQAQPALGGTGTDCNDGLDNDGDKLIDYPKDTGCASATDPTETPGTTKPDAGPAAPDARADGEKTTTDRSRVPESGPPGDGPQTDRAGGDQDGPASSGDRAVVTDAPGGCACTAVLGRPPGWPPLALLLAAFAVLCRFYRRI